MLRRRPSMTDAYEMTVNLNVPLRLDERTDG